MLSFWQSKTQILHNKKFIKLKIEKVSILKLGRKMNDVKPLKTIRLFTVRPFKKVKIPSKGEIIRLLLYIFRLHFFFQKIKIDPSVLFSAYVNDYSLEHLVVKYITFKQNRYMTYLVIN